MKEIHKSESKWYLQQAEEFLESAKNSFTQDLLNASGFNAIQSMINANDALCIQILGRRASTDHREAIKLHIDVINSIHDASMKKRFMRALELRSEVGYLGKPISKNTAEKLLKNAIVFNEWVKTKIL